MPGRPVSHAAGPEAGRTERLQKVLAHAGLGSRRECEEYIVQGRVTVDGKVVKELGTRVDPQAAIAVDGERIQLERMVYFAVNKPKGYVSTNDDPAGRPRVIDLLPEVPERVYSVGRLDEDSTGLMILTNDGELANRLAHPRFGVEKTYRALVAGTPDRSILSKLTEGIWLSDGKVRAKRARFVGSQGEATIIELVLAEGKKREIRRMLAKLGHKVMSLSRIAIGPVVLKGLPIGEARPLTLGEIELLKKVAAGIEVAPPRFADQGPGHRGSRGPKGAHPAPGPPGRGRGRVERDIAPDQKRPRREREPSARPPGKPPIPGIRVPGAGQGRPGAETGESGHPPRPTLPGRKPGIASGTGGPARRPEPPGGRKAGSPLPGRKPAGPSPAPPSPPPLRGRRVADGKEPSVPRPTRKIIGLDPNVAAEAGISLTGRPTRKRPGVKKRPPRKASGLRRPGERSDEG